METTLRPLPFAVLALALVCVGCSAQPKMNPSFPVTLDQAASDLARMQSEPRQLNRPLLIIGGVCDPGVTPTCLGWEFDSLAMSQGVVTVPMAECITFDGCRKKVIDALEQVYPSGDPKQTVEVDVIGLSLGGVVARYAALPQEGGKRLRIARLFTISSPLSGARLASKWTPPFTPVFRQLASDSEFLEKLNARYPDYPVYSYVRLHDITVGAKNAAMPGRVAWWVPNPVPGVPHQGALFDARILADIARRLRDEEPFTLNPPAPLPEKS